MASPQWGREHLLTELAFSLPDVGTTPFLDDYRNRAEEWVWGRERETTGVCGDGKVINFEIEPGARSVQATVYRYNHLPVYTSLHWTTSINQTPALISDTKRYPFKL